MIKFMITYNTCRNINRYLRKTNIALIIKINKLEISTT